MAVKFLIKKGNDIYSIDPSYYGIIRQGQPTESDFLTKGVNSLDALNATINGNIIPKNDIGNGEILIYKY